MHRAREKFLSSSVLLCRYMSLYAVVTVVYNIVLEQYKLKMDDTCI